MAKIFFDNRGKLNIEDCKIMGGNFRNFAGRPTDYDRRGGKRYFSVIIPDPDVAEQMKDDGWRVKTFIPKKEGEEPIYHLKVNVSYHDDVNQSSLDPIVHRYIGRSKDVLDHRDIGTLDKADISTADVRINRSRPDEEGLVSAYLDKLVVVIDEDWMDKKYAREESPDEEPWD